MPLCMCGCGNETTIATETDNRRGQVKGKPFRYLPHHYKKPGPDYLVTDCGYKTPCWIWQRSKRKSGYGQVGSKGRTVTAHRWMYEKNVGPIPFGLHLDHLCTRRDCVNPDHQQPVPEPVNLDRSIWRAQGKCCEACQRPF